MLSGNVFIWILFGAKIKVPTFKKNAWLEVVLVEDIGSSLYEGDILQAAEDSFEDGKGEIVELVENSDGEPCTVYDVKCFKLHICSPSCADDKRKIIENGNL